MTLRLQLLTASAVLVAAGMLAGCGGTSKTAATQTATTATHKASPRAHTPTKKTEATSCFRVTPALNHAILAHVVLANARLLSVRAARAPETPAYYYVSGSISGTGAKHLVATWVTSGLDGQRPIYSVDANAALISLFGASSEASLALSIDAPGAYRSRTCVGGSHAEPGLPAPVGSRGAPAGQ
jgi:hypothetical protein